MNIKHIKQNGIDMVLVSGKEKIIKDAQSALDLAMTAKYECGSYRIAIDKNVVAEEIFVFSSGMAGEILQKFLNYHIKAAVFGDYSHYTSKPLKDFIYEANCGKDFFFLTTKEEALNKLTEV